MIDTERKNKERLEKGKVKTRLNFINNILLGLDVVVYSFYFSLVTIAAFAANALLEKHLVTNIAIKLAKMNLREAIMVAIIYIALTTINYIFRDKKAVQYAVFAVSCGIVVGYVVSIIKFFL